MERERGEEIKGIRYGNKRRGAEKKKRRKMRSIEWKGKGVYTYLLIRR